MLVEASDEHAPFCFEIRFIFLVYCDHVHFHSTKHVLSDAVYLREPKIDDQRKFLTDP